MALISMHDVSWGFGGAPLIEAANLQIKIGERVCLVGRNGAGKSSLLKLLSRRLAPDNGEIRLSRGIALGVMEQEVPQGVAGTVFDVVASGLDTKRTGPASRRSKDHPLWQGEDADTAAYDLNDRSRSVETILSRTGLDPQLTFTSLSAGMKRRTYFARALVSTPDVLLLDEPTNHLDIQAIEWMESFLLRYAKTLLFVTHDRSFLKKIATRVVELDRGQLASYDCDYDTYLKRRVADLETQARHHRQLDKKLSQEEAWIRQGIKARRTRNEGRVRALHKLRAEVRHRRVKTGQVRMQLQEADTTGKMVIRTRALNLDYDSTPIVRELTTTVMRGDKVGIIGPNGAGKTTLLNLLLKHTAPDSGTVDHGTHLQVAYFDQLRVRLDEDLTVAQNLSPGNDYIVFNQQKRHVIGYLQDFLFSPQQCRTPVKILSGGERNRLMLAKLFTQPANVLVLDEPTNDLDTDTLELLEELVLDYEGTVLLVSHDRSFLNNVVTSTLVFEGHGRIVAYAGGYDDWLAQRPPPDEAPLPREKTMAKARPPARPVKVKKLGYMQTRELEELPGRIEALESEQQDIHATMADPAFYKHGKEDISAMRNRLSEVDRAIAEAYERWDELENFSSN